MALMNLSIWTLLDLAGPMIVILVTQTVVIMLYTYFVTFRAMGKILRCSSNGCLTLWK